MHSCLEYQQTVSPHLTSVVSVYYGSVVSLGIFYSVHQRLLYANNLFPRVLSAPLSNCGLGICVKTLLGSKIKLFNNY